MRHEVLTWADVDKLIDTLIPQLRVVGSFDAILMITRGGLIPGGLLAEALAVRSQQKSMLQHMEEAKAAWDEAARLYGILHMPQAKYAPAWLTPQFPPSIT